MVDATFSDADIKIFVSFKANEKRAVTNIGTFSIRKVNDDTAVSTDLISDFRQIAAQAEEKAREKAEAFYNDNKLAASVFYQVYNEIVGEWLAINANKYHYIYSVEDRGK